jgi:DNA-directed RNA polymerase specialized sigma24 family protein
MLNMDELRQLVAQAQTAPDRSSQRRIALSKLMSAIRQSDSIARQRNWSSIPNFQDIYDEALNETLLEICRKIATYNPQYSVMAWVNNIFNFRFQDVYQKYQKRGITNLPRQARIQWQETDRTVNSHDAPTSTREIPQPEAGDSDLKLLIDFITDDPDGLLAKEHIQNLPDATFQAILLMVCGGKSWQEIATALNTSIPTASSFYQRNLRNYLPYLQNHLQ